MVRVDTLLCFSLHAMTMLTHFLFAVNTFINVICDFLLAKYYLIYYNITCIYLKEKNEVKRKTIHYEEVF